MKETAAALIHRLLLPVKKILYKKTKGCIFGRGARFSRDTEFEGGNLLLDGSKLTKSSIGFASYLGEGSRLHGCRIGKYTSIGPYVKILIGRHPLQGFVSTHPAFYSLRKQTGFTYAAEQKFEEFAPLKYQGKYSTYIGNDVWIGSDVRIVDGVSIGDGAVILPGAVVTKDVEAYGIYGGIPARKLRDRFEKEAIEFLEEWKWWDLPQDKLRELADDFDNMDRLMRKVKGYSGERG